MARRQIPVPSGLLPLQWPKYQVPTVHSLSPSIGENPRSRETESWSLADSMREWRLPSQWPNPSVRSQPKFSLDWRALKTHSLCKALPKQLPSSSEFYHKEVRREVRRTPSESNPKLPSFLLLSEAQRYKQGSQVASFYNLPGTLHVA